MSFDFDYEFVRPFRENALLVFGSAALFFAVHFAVRDGAKILRPSIWDDLHKRQRKPEKCTPDSIATEMATRVVAILFSSYAAVRAIQILLSCSPTLASSLYESDPRVQALFSVATGYFLWDLYVCIVENWGAAFLLHAVACLFVFVGGLRPFLHHMGTICLLYELSTPFMHLRRILIDVGLGHTKLASYVGYIFALAFFASRIVIGWSTSFFWWGDMLRLIGSGQAHSLAVVYTYLACNLALSSLNGVWMYQIVSRALAPSSGTEEDDDGDRPGASAEGLTPAPKKESTVSKEEQKKKA